MVKEANKAGKRKITQDESGKIKTRTAKRTIIE